METVELRKQIHGYIDKADDRFVNLVHAMMLADLEESEFELSDEHKRILDERLKHEPTKNGVSGVTTI